MNAMLLLYGVIKGDSLDLNYLKTFWSPINSVKKSRAPG